MCKKALGKKKLSAIKLQGSVVLEALIVFWKAFTLVNNKTHP
jgi:hypothetical protein